MNNQQPGWLGIKAYRDMRGLWDRLPRSDQKIWLDFMDAVLEEWVIGERASFFIGIVVGACLYAIVWGLLC